MKNLPKVVYYIPDLLLFSVLFVCMVLWRNVNGKDKGGCTRAVTALCPPAPIICL